MGREGVVIPPRGGTFLTPEGALLLVSTKNPTSGLTQVSEHMKSFRLVFSANQICHI